MKFLVKPSVINRFSAISTTFRKEFARQLRPRQKVNLRISTVLSKGPDAHESQWLESLLEIWHQGAMVFDSTGNVIQTTEFTERVIGKYFSKSELTENGVPVELVNWMKLYRFDKRDDGVVITQEPFIVEEDGNELRIRVIVDNASRRKTLLLRETLQIQPDGLMSLGLTKRESEVLFLIAKGKTNPEISILLDISTRTVQKHVEHIYIKLGVESRTAAMLRVNELNPNLTSEGFSTA